MAYFDIRSADEYKLVVLVREDIKMSKGKIAAQTGHAAVNCVLSIRKKDPDSFDKWSDNNQPIITLRVDSERELFEFKAIADAQDINNSVVCDAGRTEIEPGTFTCLGIGPASALKIDKITGNLKKL